jgi:hypothetical protein
MEKAMEYHDTLNVKSNFFKFHRTWKIIFSLFYWFY